MESYLFQVFTTWIWTWRGIISYRLFLVSLNCTLDASIYNLFILLRLFLFDFEDSSMNSEELTVLFPFTLVTCSVADVTEDSEEFRFLTYHALTSENYIRRTLQIRYIYVVCPKTD